MAGILIRASWAISGGATTIILPAQGDEQTSLSDMWIHQPGVGTHTYSMEAKTVNTSDSPAPRSRRRVIVVMRFRK